MNLWNKWCVSPLNVCEAEPTLIKPVKLWHCQEKNEWCYCLATFLHVRLVWSPVGLEAAELVPKSRLAEIIWHVAPQGNAGIITWHKEWGAEGMENLWSAVLVLTKPLFWKMLSFYGALKGECGQAWEGIMAEYVLAANLLGREHKGSRSSVNILIKITVYVQRWKRST